MILGNTYDISLRQWRANANTLLSAQEFYFAIFMTVLYVPLECHLCCVSLLTFSSVLIPWVTLREVPVEVEIVSAL